MLIRKKVTSHGTGGKLLVPASKIGCEAIILIDDDYQKFRELIANAYLLNQMESAKYEELNNKIKDLQDIVFPRLALLERVLASKLNVDTRGSGNEQESQSEASESSGESTDNSSPSSFPFQVGERTSP